MKRLVIVLVLVVIAAGIYSCRKDVFIPAPPSVVGAYTGTYSYKLENQTEISQCVNWRFYKDSFLMLWDSLSEGCNTRFFCDVTGDYSLSNALTLENVKMSGVITCNQSLNPTGSFVLDQTVANQVSLRQVTVEDGKTVTRTITLNAVNK